MGRYALCYLLSIPALAIFFFGIYSKLSLWFSGSIGDFDANARPAGFGGVWKQAALVIFSKEIPRFIGVIFLDAIVGRRLFRLSRARWATHALMIYGFIALLLTDTAAIFMTWARPENDIKDIPARSLES